jgi:mycothiol synthase
MSSVRQARREDLEPAVQVLNEHARRLHGVDDLAPDDLLNYWESPDVDLEQDILLAENAEGDVVGYADVGVQGDHVWLDIRSSEPRALPDLLEAIERRAAEKKPGGKLMGYTSADDESLRMLYEQSGYDLVRHSFRMRIDLDQDIRPPEWPEGFSVRTLREGEERRVYDAQMASFADTWMFTPDPYENWVHWFVKDTAFDPSLWFLVEANDTLAGIVIARANENEPGLGWIRILGVIPEHRRKGLAQALLRHTFAEFARRGFAAVGLGVDAENPTGAVRVYERAGMHVERTHLIFERSQR